MTKMVPTAQAGDDTIPDMLPVACDDNAKGTCTTETTKVTILMRKPKICQHHFKQLYFKNDVYPSNQVCSIDLSYLP